MDGTGVGILKINDDFPFFVSLEFFSSYSKNPRKEACIFLIFAFSRVVLKNV